MSRIMPTTLILMKTANFFTLMDTDAIGMNVKLLQSALIQNSANTSILTPTKKKLHVLNAQPNFAALRVLMTIL